MLPIHFYPPGVLPSIHIALYLPTAGNESTFTEQIAVLSTLLLDLNSRHPRYPVFIRGDANVTPKNKTRYNQLNLFADNSTWSERALTIQLIITLWAMALQTLSLIF